MGRNYELDALLKNGKGMKITGLVFVAAAVVMIAAFWKAQPEIGFVFFIIFMLAALMFFIIGFNISSSKRKTIDRIEINGETETVLEDYHSVSTVKLDKKGRTALGSKYLFLLGGGKIYSYADIMLVYVAVNRQNGIPVSQVLMVCTSDGKRSGAISEKMSKDGTVRLNSYMAIIKERNPNCMIGYSVNNLKAYRAIVRQNKKAQ